MPESTAKRIAPHLPLLRRYARALTGSQESGDAFVRATLEAMVAGEKVIDEDLPPRLALYKLFNELWSSLFNQGRAEDQDSAIDSVLAPRAELRLAKVPPLSRQAFLLTAMEDFDVSEAATIMAASADEVRRLVSAAMQQIEAQTSTRVLIIEDEPLIGIDLQEIVEGMGHAVTGIARTHAEAITLAKRASPGLILSDIQLADGSSGLEATNQLLETIDAPVIFITAFPERLLTGDRPEPAFLITKPFNEATVRAAIAQILFFNESEPVAA